MTTTNGDWVEWKGLIPPWRGAHIQCPTVFRTKLSRVEDIGQNPHPGENKKKRKRKRKKNYFSLF